jgi:hypothetical protein
LIVAERRDLIVATYSFARATGCNSTAAVCTGNPCISGPAAACFLWHPAANTPTIITEAIAAICFPAEFLTRFSFAQARAPPVCSFLLFVISPCAEHTLPTDKMQFNTHTGSFSFRLALENPMNVPHRLSRLIDVLPQRNDPSAARLRL